MRRASIVIESTILGLLEPGEHGMEALRRRATAGAAVLLSTHELEFAAGADPFEVANELKG